jgi:hypothetical protein
MRIEGVGKLPDLLDELLNQAKDTTDKINGKIAQAYEFAKAIEPPVPAPLEAVPSLAAQLRENFLKADGKQQGKR